MTETQGQKQGGGSSGLIVLVVIVLALVGGVVMLQKKAAADAEKAVAEGKAAYGAKSWEQAYTLLEKGLKIKDDAEGKTMAQDARKNHRNDLVADAAKATDPDAALATLEKAQGISPDADVAKKVEEAKYAAGKKALEAKKLDRAIALFTAIPDYKDAKALAAQAQVELDYAEAEASLATATEALKAGKPMEAVAAITSAVKKGEKAPPGKPPIAEAAAKVKDGLLDAAGQLKEEVQALAIYRAIDGHKDSAARAAALEPKVYGAAKDAMHKGDLARAKACLTALGAYKDAPALLKEVEARGGTPKATWAAVGKPSSYRNTKHVVALAGYCWTVDGSGTMWKTDAKGERTKVGKDADWASTTAIVAMDGFLYSVEKDGTLYRTDRSGKYDQIGKGSLGNVRALVGLDGALYSLEGGDLYQTQPTTGKWQPIGARNQWKDVRLLAGFKGKLWSVDQNGTLFRTKPNGNADKAGKDGDWKETRWMVPAGDFIYSIEKTGTLYRTDASAAYKQVGEDGSFKDTIGIAAEGDTIYTVETDGTLYSTTVKSG